MCWFGLNWFGLGKESESEKDEMDEMDEAMMKHFACTSSLAH